jgi:hypothetical protein
LAQIGLTALAPGTARIHWQGGAADPPNRQTRVVATEGALPTASVLFQDYVLRIAGGGP